MFVWCGFQTGNFVQLSLALARLFSVGPGGAIDQTFHRADQQALTSLLAFNLGAFIGRLGDRIGSQKRIWLVFGTFLQTLFTMAAALTIWKSGQPSVADDRGDPSWTNALSFVCLAFMSMSLGTQGIIGKRLNTQFTTTSTYVYHNASSRLNFFLIACSRTNHRLGRTHGRSPPFLSQESHYSRPQTYRRQFALHRRFRLPRHSRQDRLCGCTWRWHWREAAHHCQLAICPWEESCFQECQVTG